MSTFVLYILYVCDISGFLWIYSSCIIGLLIYDSLNQLANDNFAANAGIFEELNDQSRGKREIRKHLNSMAKFQSWIEETLERGLLNIFRYILYRVKNTLGLKFI